MMPNIAIESFDVWTDAQGLKAKGRVKSVDNISLTGIASLRQLILDLAAQGKLTKQNLKDEPAVELLKKIIALKEKLVKEGKIRSFPPSTKITEVEKPFTVPNNWEFVRLGDISLGSTGKTPSTSISKYFGGDIQFLGPGQITSNGIITKSDKTLTNEGSEQSTVTEIGDILIVCIGGTIGKCAIVKANVAFNQQINCVHPLLIETEFLFLMMNNSYFQKTILLKATGSATPIINRSKLEEILVPLPPLAEQQRIVAKVDELMALCDRLEEEQTKNLKTHQQLVSALLHALTSVSDAEEFQSSWQQISTHFDTLFCTEDSIDQLKQTILQLAIMGRLVKQNPKDEPASEFLKRVKKGKALLHTNHNNIENTIPNGWTLCKLGDVIELEMGQSPDGSSYNDTGIGVPLINGPVEFGPGPFDKTLKTKFTSAPTKMCKEGDLLVCVRGATTGRTNIAAFDACIGRGVAAITPYFDKKYLNYFMLKSRYSILSLGTGTTFPSISKDDILNINFYLPPVAEQERIVVKIDELFAICDTLKERIVRSQNLKVLLSKTVVEKVVQ